MSSGAIRGCVIVAFAAAMACFARAQRVSSGSQVVLIARMADTFTIDWPSPSATPERAASGSQPTILDLHAADRLVPGTSLSVACVGNRRATAFGMRVTDSSEKDSSEKVAQESLLRAKLPLPGTSRWPGGRRLPVCNGVFQPAPWASAEDLTIQIVSKHDEATAHANTRLDVILSAL